MAQDIEIKEEKNNYQKGSMKRFMHYFKPWPVMKLFLLDSFFALIIAGAAVGLPFLTKFITQQAQDLSKGLSSDFGPLYFAIGMIAVVFFLQLLAQFVVTYWGHMMGIRMEINMRRDIIKKMHRLPTDYYDKTPTGTLISRLVMDIRDIPEFAHHVPENLIIAVVTCVGGFTFAFLQSWIVGVVFAGIFFVGIFLLYIVRIKWREIWIKVRENNSRMSSSIGRQVESISEIKSFASEKYEQKLFEGIQQNHFNIHKRFYKVEGTANVSSMLVSITNTAIALIAGALLVAHNKITIPEYVGLTSAAAVINKPIQTFVSAYTMLSRGGASVSRYFEMMDLPEERNVGKITDFKAKGLIEFENVSFAYETSEGNKVHVLKNFNLKIKAGERIAFVGETGIGKSTLLKLVLRFYDIQEGAIYLDGVNIDDIEIHNLRKQFGYIQQHATIFDDSYVNNIAYGHDNASGSEYQEAAKDAYADEFIKKSPEGYETIVGPRGAKLSGGQKQRVSIARTIMQENPILLLDEATSALDNDTESKIKKSIDKYGQGKTMLVVAHRLTTIQDVDRVIVLGQGGKILEEGSYKELAKKKGGHLNKLDNIQ